MSLTFSLLAALLWLLPGITGLIFWNNLGRRHGVRRPDQPLTALNSLALAGGISLAAHLVGILASELVVRALTESGITGLASPYRAMAWLMTRPSSGAGARPIDDTDLAGLVAFGWLLVGLCFLVALFMRNRGLGLVLDGLDSHSQGWAFQHIIDPMNHGYVQLAYVLTNTVDDGRGLGYAGGIADIRISDDGEVKALTLSEPNRFLYTIGSKSKPRDHISVPKSWRSMVRQGGIDNAIAAGLSVKEAKPVGGAIYLPAANIRNILVLNFREAALRAVEEEVAPATTVAPVAPASSPAPAAPSETAPDEPVEAPATPAPDAADVPVAAPPKWARLRSLWASIRRAAAWAVS